MISDVLSGIGVVIDDEILGGGEESNRIQEIVSELEAEKLPILKFAERPDEQTVSNLKDVCFLILDWKFDTNVNQMELDEIGLNLGEEYQKVDSTLNIELIRTVRSQCFAPIFIFSNEPLDEIRNALTDAGLSFDNEDRDLIFLRSKSELRDQVEGENLVANTIVGWVNRNPAVYLFEVWKRAMSISQTSLFRDLYDQAPSWPKILWSAYKADSVDPNYAITEIMQKNIRARLPRMSLEEERLEGDEDVDKVLLKKLLEFSIFIPDDSLTNDEIGTGDVFRIGNGRKILVNIRCDCDTIPRGSKTEGNTFLYCLEGKAIPDSEFKKDRFHQKYGLKHVRDNEHTVFPILSGRAAVVKFSELHPLSIAQLKDENWTRVGRLTPPIITQIRQRFSLWLQREGVAKIPVEAVFDAADLADAESQ